MFWYICVAMPPGRRERIQDLLLRLKINMKLYSALVFVVTITQVSAGDLYGTTIAGGSLAVSGK